MAESKEERRDRVLNKFVTWLNDNSSQSAADALRVIQMGPDGNNVADYSDVTFFMDQLQKGNFPGLESIIQNASNERVTQGLADLVKVAANEGKYQGYSLSKKRNKYNPFKRSFYMRRGTHLKAIAKEGSLIKNAQLLKTLDTQLARRKYFGSKADIADTRAEVEEYIKGLGINENSSWDALKHPNKHTRAQELRKRIDKLYPEEALARQVQELEAKEATLSATKGNLFKKIQKRRVSKKLDKLNPQHAKGSVEAKFNKQQKKLDEKQTKLETEFKALEDKYAKMTPEERDSEGGHQLAAEIKAIEKNIKNISSQQAKLVKNRNKALKNVDARFDKKAKKQEKSDSKKVTALESQIKQMDARSAEIDAQLKSPTLTKKQQKKLRKEQEKIAKKRNKLDKKENKLLTKFQKKESKIRNNTEVVLRDSHKKIGKHCDYINEKNETLQDLHSYGKAYDKIMELLPEDLKKGFEDAVGARTEKEAIHNEAEFAELCQQQGLDVQDMQQILTEHQKYNNPEDSGNNTTDDAESVGGGENSEEEKNQEKEQQEQIETNRRQAEGHDDEGNPIVVGEHEDEASRQEERTTDEEHSSGGVTIDKEKFLESMYKEGQYTQRLVQTDEKDVHFLAKKQENGEFRNLTLDIKDPQHVTFKATTVDGNPAVPSVEDFQALARAYKAQGITTLVVAEGSSEYYKLNLIEALETEGMKYELQGKDINDETFKERLGERLQAQGRRNEFETTQGNENKNGERLKDPVQKEFEDTQNKMLEMARTLTPEEFKKFADMSKNPAFKNLPKEQRDALRELNNLEHLPQPKRGENAPPESPEVIKAREANLSRMKGNAVARFKASQKQQYSKGKDKGKKKEKIRSTNKELYSAMAKQKSGGRG